MRSRLRRTGLRRAGVAAAGALALALLPACSGGNDSGSSAATGTTAASSPSGSPEAAAGSTPAGGTTAGGSPSPAASPAATAITVTAVDFGFRMSSTDLPAGTYTITLANQGHATHDLVVERDGADVARSDSIGPGASTSFSATLTPGQYVFFCSIDGHRAMGMQTSVTVSG